MDQDIGVLEDGFHRLDAGNEVRADVASVELHALDVLGLEGEALALFDGDHTVLADLVHHLGDQVADFLVGGGDRCDVGNVFPGLDVDRHLLDRFDDRIARLLDAALEQHRVGAGGDHFQTLGDHGVRQHGGGGGAVAGHVVGLGGGFLEELRAHVLVRVAQLDLLGDGDAVVGDGRSAEFLVERDVAALGAEGGGNGGRQDIHARLQ